MEFKKLRKRKELCVKCQSCLKKVIIPIVIIVALAVGGYLLFCKEATINDLHETTVKHQGEITIKSDAQKSFAIAEMTPVAPINGGLTSIDNISDFNRVSKSNATSAEAIESGRLTIPTIHTKFALNHYELSAEYCDLIGAFAKLYLQTNLKSTIMIDGYACNNGTDEFNMKISQQRALSVKSLLEQLGVPSSKIESRWFGESKNVGLKYETIEEYRRVNIYIK